MSEDDTRSVTTTGEVFVYRDAEAWLLQAVLITESGSGSVNCNGQTGSVVLRT